MFDWLSKMWNGTQPTTGDFARFDRGQTDSVPVATPGLKDKVGLSESERKALAMKFLSQGLQQAGQQGQLATPQQQQRSTPQLISGGQQINPMGGR